MKKARRWAALLSVGLVSCSGASSSSISPHPAAVQTIPIQAGAGATFAGMSSPAILEAAMRYPTPKVAEEPPVSLTASDGTGLRLVSMEAKAVMEGPLAFTEMHLSFENPRDRVIEGRFAITLPPGAAVSRLAMRTAAGWQEAEVVERQLARQAYEDFLHRRQDPALLEKEAGNEFRARIFPIPARGTKEIVLSYSQEVTAGQSYRLPLRGLPEIADLRVTALAGKDRTHIEAQGKKPDRDFEVAVPAGFTGLRNEELVLARVKPELAADRTRIDSLAILFDTSASRAPGFAREVGRLGRLVGELGKLHGGEARLVVAAFDQTVAPIYEGPLREFGKQHLDALLARRPLGASDLTAALGWLAQAAKGGRALLVTDGVGTAGATEGDALVAAARTLKGSVERLDLLLGGGIRDEEIGRRLVRNGVAKDGVLLDGGLTETEIARRMSLTTQSGIAVKVAGAEWVWPETIDGAQPGDETLVYAGMRKGALAAGKPLAISLEGPLHQKLDVALTPVARPLLERAAATAEIARLSLMRDRLPADDKQKRDLAREQIIHLSTRFRVLSDFTALLVLESRADYDRYGIDRRALADILTVGDRGVEIARRPAPVLVAAADELEAPAKTPKKKEAREPGREANKDEGKKRDKGGDAPMQSAEPKPQKPATGAEEHERDGDGAPDFEGRAGLAEPAASVAPRAMAAPGPAAITPRPPASPAPPPPPLLEPPAMDRRPAEAEPAAARSPTAAPVTGPPPYAGRMAAVMKLLEDGRTESGIVEALRWQADEPGDVMALVGLGETLEAAGNRPLAARAYGSILDLFPSRADMRRFAAERLERLGADGARLAADAYAKAVEERPDHLNAHRLLAYSLLRDGKLEAAFGAAEAGLSRSYPVGRFLGGDRILREDLGLIAAAWLKQEPNRRADVEGRLAKLGAVVATRPSLRFVLYWETDANDVDFHIHDARGGHAFYQSRQLPSGGALYEDVTTGYGPECFTIEGTPQAYPYHLQIHYYSRGPMGYGMGKLEIVEHDGRGGLKFEQRPFVVMNDGAFVDLGEVKGPLGG